jgi:hypothetical protein
MPVYLQRVRFTVHTKKQFLAGTNSAVKLCYQVEEKHLHPKLGPGVHCADLDQPYHDDFQSGKADSYEVSFGSGSLGQALGQPVPNGLQFDSLDDARKMKIHLKIEGNDQWIFDRCALAGYFIEVRPVAGQAEAYEEVELGWLEMARQSGDVAMSSDESEGCEEYPIELNGTFQ